MNAFQEVVERERARLKLTWQELSKRSGIPYQTLRRMILSENPEIPKREQLRQLARGLNVPLPVLQYPVVRVYVGWELFQEETEEDRLDIASLKELSESERRAIRAMVAELRRRPE